MFVRLIAGLPCGGVEAHAASLANYDHAVVFNNPDLESDINKIKEAIIRKQNIVVTHDDFCNPVILGSAYDWFKKHTMTSDIQCLHVLKPPLGVCRKNFEKLKTVQNNPMSEERFNELMDKYQDLYVPLNISNGINYVTY